MSEPHGRHAGPDAPAGDEEAPEAPAAPVSASLPHPGRARRFRPLSSGASGAVWFWTVPVVITLAVLSALAAFYFGGLLKPMDNLRHFPIAVVNEDAGPNGAQVVKRMQAEFDKDAYNLRALSRDAAKHQLDTGQIYGAAVIPPNFSSKLKSYAKSALGAGRVDRPVIIVSTNPRAGALGASIAGQALNRAVAIIDELAGRRLVEEVKQQTHGAPLPGAATLLLANPIEVKPVVHRALPDGTGDGLSAFYYALLLLLGGFIGSFVVSMLADAMLASGPTASPSRFRMLLNKWALMVVLALVTSGVYVLIAGQLGMPIQHGLALWLFGAFAIAAVGIASISLIAVLGSVGLLVSLFLFVILGLPSAGATVPLEATPQFFGWLAKIEPMHQVYLGARALLYLDGQADAGLSQSVELTAVGLVIGLLLGGIVTRIYDRRDHPATPSESAVVPSAPEQSPAETAAATPSSEAIAETTHTDE